MRQPIAALGAIAMLVVLSTCAAASAGPSSSPRPADSFTGRVSSTTGHWRAHHGRLAVRLVPSGSAARRHLVIDLSARRCATATGCLRLHGSLTGTITRLPGKPDQAGRFSIKAAGVIARLGQVRGAGIASSPGFIHDGRVTLILTLTDSRGSVTVSAASAPVPGFTSP